MFKAIAFALMAMIGTSAMAQERTVHREVHREVRQESRDHRHNDRHVINRDQHRGHAYGHRHRDRMDRPHSVRKIVKRVCNERGCRTVVKYVRR